MDKELIKAFLEAFAVGDAYGKATENCSRSEIEESFKRIDTILKPKNALAHQDLPYGHVTDDTEQNFYLIEEYARKGRVDAHDTALCLLRWFNETDVKSCTGPSSFRALSLIRDGGDIDAAGRQGTTCGGIMRVPSAFLFSTKSTLESNVVQCLKPTHYTSVAIEAAMAYAFALQAASEGLNQVSILNQACIGAEKGAFYGNHARLAGVGPSVAHRIRFLQKSMPAFISEDAIKTMLYSILGSTIASYDVASSVFGLFLYAGKDVSLAIRLATEMGGDTDTIACLTAGLCTIYAKGHNINRNLVNDVVLQNHLDLDRLAELVASNYIENN